MGLYIGRSSARYVCTGKSLFRSFEYELLGSVGDRKVYCTLHVEYST